MRDLDLMVLADSSFHGRDKVLEKLKAIDSARYTVSVSYAIYTVCYPLQYFFYLASIVEYLFHDPL